MFSSTNGEKEVELVEKASVARVCGALTFHYGALILLLGVLPSILLEEGDPMVQWVLDPAWGGVGASLRP